MPATLQPETIARLALLDESPLATLALTPDWRCAYANAALAAMLGRPLSGLVGLPAGELFSDSTGTPFEAACRFAMEEGVRTTAEAVVTPPGRWFEVTAFPVEGGIGVLLADITARKAHEEAQQAEAAQEARQQVIEAERARRLMDLRESQKRESLGVLAGGIAHDFNNLLVAILGNASIALADLETVHPARAAIEDVEKAAHRAADLTRQLLAYAGRGHFVTEKLDLGAQVQEITATLRAALSPKATLRLEFGRDLPAIEGDATQVRQVVMNLLTNASDALGEAGGVITVRMDSRIVSGGLAGAPTLADGTYVCLEITDTGHGMDAATKARIFEPFFTTKFTWRGLGLAAAKGILEGHGGAITVRSEPNDGATFTVYFPALAEQAPVAAPPLVMRKTPPGTVVLVVDDEPLVRRAARTMLERQGVEVLEAADGEQALAVYQQNRDRVRAVLLDLAMPRMDGQETLKRLRASPSSVPVLLMSGYDEDNVTGGELGRGAAGFLQKPFRAADLAKGLERVLAS
ncbi:MAG: response regulator [Gemmatimonadetes bacterium]|nr:response regulator [Gemmatimonadota bacterium]